MRGYRSDYDQWGLSAGSELWSWSALLPHFRRLEGNQKFNNEFHGGSGPLKVADPGFSASTVIYLLRRPNRSACHSPRTST